jgi:hypothetical protein
MAARASDARISQAIDLKFERCDARHCLWSESGDVL